jgi:multidrug transporter EmrE-like cation transporter
VELLQLIVAAVLFAVGGLFMKLSEGATRAVPTTLFLAFFAAGALLQAVVMRRTDLGSAYIAVLGLEAIATLLLSVVVLGERYSAGRIVAIVLIVAGVALLRRA